jgi:hypothetical protein
MIGACIQKQQMALRDTLGVILPDYGSAKKTKYLLAMRWQRSYVAMPHSIWKRRQARAAQVFCSAGALAQVIGQKCLGLPRFCGSRDGGPFAGNQRQDEAQAFGADYPALTSSIIIAGRPEP